MTSLAEPSTPNPAQIYEDFTVRYQLEPWAASLLELASPRAGERALDLACGTGVVTRHLAPLLGSSGTVIGVDISPAMLQIARSLTPPAGAGVEWREGDAQDLPLGDHLFDLVICQQGLQFVPDRVRALKEIRRVLADGGRLAFSVWCDLQFHSIYETLFAVIARRFPESRVAAAFSFGDVQELERALNESSFSEVQIETREQTTRFPSADEFLVNTLRAGAAVNPAAAQISPAERQALFAEIEQEVGPLVRERTEDGQLVFPMRARYVLARP